jgi:hypothetical protein
MPPTGLEPATTAPAAKTNLVLTKPVEIQSQYGKITVPAGTAAKLISRQGAILTVSTKYGVINVQATSTDLE